MRNNSKRYSLKDRFSIAKSKEMFLIIQSFHNPMNNIERAIRSWNGGMRYKVTRTQRYFEKVMRALNKKRQAVCKITIGKSLIMQLYQF